ncbi:unnamed protein product [Moneuplotes crassus]|uniref:RING-type domain-containing protein n=1 Tax=Euplotes crassus TaxID=5936 RepID=A0AAD1XV27_EUPCR|nr:unnamed protein product [Moneuplotes crassus]
MDRFGSIDESDICDEAEEGSIFVSVPETKIEIKRPMVKCINCDRMLQTFANSPVCQICKDRKIGEVSEEEKIQNIRVADIWDRRNAIRLDLSQSDSSEDTDRSDLSSDLSSDCVDSDSIQILQNFNFEAPRVRTIRRRYHNSDARRGIIRNSFRRRVILFRDSSNFRSLSSSFGSSISSPRPANQTALDDLKSVQITDEHLTLNPKTGQKESPCCCVCTDEMQIEATILLCKHLFHTECIKEWFKSHNTCPICRSNVNRLTCTPILTSDA